MIEDFKGCRLYLDANIFIYAVEGFAKYSNLAISILDAADDGLFQAVTSELTVAEVLVGPLRNRRPDVAEAYVSLLREPTLRVEPITRPILSLSAELRATDRGKLADAIHCATGLRTQCQYLLTGDRTFKVSRGLELVLLDDLLAKSNG